ncbi:hypothetical protein AAFP30_03590 [Gordonia sp. CPCC 205515]|uniref:hypothetical protein n=1 Tax=Gordonia sp. CPCC 205515 TaxID=3140791 RepID=UPI003AF36E09
MTDSEGGSSQVPAPDDRTPDIEPVGKRARSVPAWAWLVLALALVALLVLLIVRPAWSSNRDSDSAFGATAPDRQFTKSLAASGHADGIWLDDSSASSSYLVTLPADTPREQTRLHVTGTSQVPDDSTVFLSVTMDGQQVYKQELAKGDNEISADIDVPTGLADDGQVRIAFRADGTRNVEQCTLDHSAGMQIHLDPETAIQAVLAEPIHTVRDAVVAWDRDVTIVLADTGFDWRTAAAQLGMALTRDGHRVTYADAIPGDDVHDAILLGPADSLNGKLGWSASQQDSGEPITVGSAGGVPVVGVTTTDGPLIATFLTQPTVSTADSAENAPKAVTPAPVAGNSVPVDLLDADTSVGDITESRDWHIRYTLGELPGGRLPQAIRVAMTLPASPSDLTWMLNVELNDQLVGSRPLNPTNGQVTIPLPPQGQLVENTVTLSVNRDRDLGGCDVRVTTYPIQLQASSALLLGDDPGAGFTALPRALAPGFAVYVPNTDGVDAIDELNAIVPTLTTFVPAQYNPDFRWNTQPAAGQPFIVVGPSSAVNPTVRIDDGRIVAGPDNTTLDIPTFDNGLLVEATRSTTKAAGLYLQYQGSIGTTALPDFGRETAQVVTTQRSFTINADGTVAPQ